MRNSFKDKTRQDKITESKRILLAEDFEEYAALAAKKLKRDGHTIQTANSIEEIIALLEKNTFDIIYIDRGLPFSRGQYRDDHEDAKPFAQSIKRKGEIPDFLDGKILEENRNATIILSTGVKGGLPDRLDGIDMIATKQNHNSINYIEMALGTYRLTYEEQYEVAKETMTDFEMYLFESLCFSKSSPIAGQWMEASDLYSFYLEQIPFIKDRDNPENPYHAFLSEQSKPENLPDWMKEQMHPDDSPDTRCE